MGLSAHYLRSHVSWCPRCIIFIILFIFPGNPHIRYPRIPKFIKHYILRLNIPMNDFIIMQVFQSKKDTADKKLSLLLSEPSLHTNMKPQIPSTHIIHHQVKVFPVMEGNKHIDNELMLQLTQ
jgi:hypothetical protein